MLLPPRTEDDARLYSFRVTSEPFAVSRGVTAADVIGDFVRSASLCSGPYDIVRQRRLHPDNPSLVIVEADIRCPAAPRTATPAALAAAPDRAPEPATPPSPAPSPRHGFDPSVSRPASAATTSTGCAPRSWR